MKKRLLTMLTLCSCAVLLASCRASADTRTGQADGYGGILRVQVMMEDGAISAVNILEQHETDGIGSRALDILPDEMIRMNTWDVDVVTGATMTSNALREAVRVALNASGTMDEATGNPANRAGQAVREGIGMAATGRVGPGKDDEDGQVYSFNVVFAHGTFDEDGRIVSMAVDQLEVATPNYSGASMPQFSGFPGQGGYSLWDDNTGKVVGYTEDSEDNYMHAFLSSVGSLIITLTVTEPFCRAILIHFLLNTGMVVLCFGRSPWRTFLENWAVIYLMVLFLGGVMELLKNSAAGMTFFWIQAVIAALILSVVTWYLGRRKQFGNQLFPVTLVHRGHAMEIMGYWDSGNQLRDPYDHRPVCILSRHMAAKILNPKKDRVHFIPYCSLGQNTRLPPVLVALGSVLTMECTNTPLSAVMSLRSMLTMAFWLRMETASLTELTALFRTVSVPTSEGIPMTQWICAK